MLLSVMNTTNTQNIELIKKLVADAGWMSDDKFFAYLVDGVQQSINELKELSNLLTEPNRITRDELLEKID